MASAPSLGYDTAYLSATPAPPPPSDPKMALTGAESPDGNEFKLSNFYLKAVVSKNSFCGLSSLLDMNDGGTDLIRSRGTGNDLVFYIDDGDIYRFGNEPSPNGCPLGIFEIDPNSKLRVTGVEWLEKGPLRLRLRTTVEFISEEMSGAYIREYTLVAGEPFLRMSITGRASLAGGGNPYSVMVKFPFANPVDALSHGTTYHWDAQLPTPSWSSGPTFLASHCKPPSISPF